MTKKQKKTGEDAKKIAATIALRKYGVHWIILFTSKHWIVRKISRLLYNYADKRI